MATTTPNIGLTKPALGEYVSLSVINENYDKIDDAIGAVPAGSNVMNEISILTAPNNTRYRLKVANDGTLSTEAIP